MSIAHIVIFSDYNCDEHHKYYYGREQEISGQFQSSIRQTFLSY